MIFFIKYATYLIYRTKPHIIDWGAQPYDLGERMNITSRGCRMAASETIRIKRRQAAWTAFTPYRSRVRSSPSTPKPKPHRKVWFFVLAERIIRFAQKMREGIPNPLSSSPHARIKALGLMSITFLAHPVHDKMLSCLSIEKLYYVIYNSIH